MQWQRMSKHRFAFLFTLLCLDSLVCNTRADAAVRCDRAGAVGQPHLWRDVFRCHATDAGDRHSDGARCACGGRTEDRSWIRSVPGLTRRGRGIDRSVRVNTIDGESLIRCVPDRPCDFGLVTLGLLGVAILAC